MGLFKASAIVLRSRDFQEADRVVTLLSDRQGKMEAVARGARRPRSRLIGATQPFCLIEASLFRGRSMDTINQAEVIEGFRGLREDLLLMAHATYVCEMVDESLGFYDVTPGVFSLVLTSLGLLRDGADPGTVRHMFQIRLLMTQGIGPEVKRCVACGRAGDTPFFHAAQGGLMCEDCGRAAGAEPISKSALESMKALARLDPGKGVRLRMNVRTKAEVSRVLDAYVLWHLDKSLKSLAFLRSLEGQK